ncbi:calcium/sodium antiporter [Candidatus Gracilibacteria bacterium]|nr:calcium/sodium antiporter [Candidatus Gracilibacteria bacterium]
MDIFISLISIVLGLVLLTFGGNVLVDGAVSIAKKFGISEAIIGLTIVAIGTSMPELIVSVLASIGGNPEIAIGNVLGSNIANIFFILGLSACIAPIALSRTTRFFDLPVLIIVTLLFLVLVSDVLLDGGSMNVIGRIDGMILMAVALAYILYSVKHNNFVPDESEVVENIASPWKATLWIFSGIAVLFIGGKILVDGAVDIAKLFGLSEAIIGLTIVAIGTSMPELATSIIAARRGNADIAVGNVVGSNVMNILVILGISSFIAPLPFADSSYVDLMVGLLGPIVLLLLSLVWTRNSIGKKDGTILMAIYFIYLAYLVSLEMM